ncbi:hypothetical protein SA21204_2131 [Staphylococcus aureus subsp. aureus 21204]|nr:hypothetical protein SA21204_2131 [Staphylococcus aureus subsp. aureus 21204]
MILKAFESYNISIKFFNNNCATKTQKYPPPTSKFSTSQQHQML